MQRMKEAPDRGMFQVNSRDFIQSWLDKPSFPGGLLSVWVVIAGGLVGLVATVLSGQVILAIAVVLILMASVARTEVGFAILSASVIGLPALQQFLPPRGLFPEEPLLICLIVSLVLIRRRRYRPEPRLITLSLLLVAVAVSQAATIIFVTLKWGVQSRDLLEIVRTLKYIFMLSIFGLADERERRWASYGVLAGLVVAVFVGLLQYFNPGNINSWLVAAYGKQTTGRFLAEIQRISGTLRIPGTLGNPNDFGTALILAILGVIATSQYLVYKKRSAITFGIVTVSCLTGLGMIVLTQSRTAILASLAALLIWAGVRAFRMRNRSILVGFIVLGLAALLLPNGMSDGDLPAIRLFDVSGARESLVARVFVWYRSLDIAMAQSPLLGLGPEKLTETLRFGELDSEYVYFLKRWGIAGFILYCSLLLAIGYMGLRLIWQKGNRLKQLYGGSLLALSAVAIIVSSAGAFWENNRVSDLFFLVVGIILGSVHASATTEEMTSVDSPLGRGGRRYSSPFAEGGRKC